MEFKRIFAWTAFCENQTLWVYFIPNAAKYESQLQTKIFVMASFCVCVYVPHSCLMAFPWIFGILLLTINFVQ